MRYLATGRVGSLTLLQVTAQQQEAGSFRARSRAREPGWWPGVPHRGSGYPAATLSRAATGKGWGGGVTRQVAWILHSQPQETWTRRGGAHLLFLFPLLFPSQKGTTRPSRRRGEKSSRDSRGRCCVVRAPRFLTPKGAEAAERKAGRVAGVGACRGRSVTLSTASWATPSSRPEYSRAGATRHVGGHLARQGHADGILFPGGRVLTGRFLCELGVFT